MFLTITLFSQSKKEIKTWETTKTRNSILAFDEFLRMYPKSKFYDSAQLLRNPLVKMKEEENAKKIKLAQEEKEKRMKLAQERIKNLRVGMTFSQADSVLDFFAPEHTGNYNLMPFMKDIKPGGAIDDLNIESMTYDHICLKFEHCKLTKWYIKE
jgi:hypothetical protein